ncbi:MAG TPA: peptidoglycan-binding protein [Streptosporangiaceae bacterium]|nr:peptidoglycan-binding protein [Streptosporangiaceae bacterium]
MAEAQVSSPDVPPAESDAARGQLAGGRLIARRIAGQRVASRRLKLASAVLGAAAVATAGVAVGESLRHSPASSGGTVRLATARVVRTNLATTTQIPGALDFANSYVINNALAGTAYTWLPAPGRIVRRGQKLYEVDGNPVFLFYGARPEWRGLSEGVTDGTDVVQLDENLIALGYASSSDLTVSDVFTGATTAAVERWQAATGQLVTGAVSLGQIAYAPGPIRIRSGSVSPGAAPQAGTAVLTATSATPVVLAQLPVGQEYLVKRGDRVSATMPDGVTTAPGVVTAISAEATASSDQQGNGPGPSRTQGPGGNQPTVQITIRLVHPRAAGNLDQAPVTVNIVSAAQNNALAVPVSALVALAGGGYAVSVVHGSTSHLVAVQTGLITSTLVQVTGSGISQGELVQVPAP